MLYIFSEDPAFADVVQSLSAILSDRKIPVKRVDNNGLSNLADDDMVIFFGLNYYQGKLPPNYIAYQLEQTGDNENSWFDDEYIAKLEGATEIWDYSMQNISNIKKLFSIKQKTLPKLQYVPITFLPIFANNKIINDSDLTKDIDVLFYGTHNERRDHIINNLKQAGVNVTYIDYSLWGQERIKLVARSHIVLNIHYYDDPILETTRIAPLVSQGAFVISEKSSDKLLDSFWADKLLFCSYDKMVERVIAFLKNVNSCRDIGLMNKKTLSKTPFMNKTNTDFLIRWALTNKIDNNENTVDINGNNNNDDGDDHRNQRKRQIMQAQCIENKNSDGSVSQTLELINISNDELPTVTIVTPTYNRSELFPIAIRNFRKTIYPADKIEWIILDDSDATHRDKVKQLVKGDYRIRYIELNERMTISEKRNYLAHLAKNEYIVHMDDDDYYNPDSVMARIKLLLKYQNKGIRCVGTTEIGIYNLLEDYSYLMDSGAYISEASMAYHKSFWQDRAFPSGDPKSGEGGPFIKDRLDQVIDMPFFFNFIAITHNKNITGRFRTRKLDISAKTQSTNFFNLWDIDTQLFFIKIRRAIIT